MGRISFSSIELILSLMCFRLPGLSSFLINLLSLTSLDRGSVLPPENNKEVLNSEQLVHRCLTGDRAAFDELVRQNMNVVFGLVVGIIHNFHTAEDLTQEVFTRACLSLPRLQEPNKFRNWVCRIARNCCLDHLRQRQAQSSLESGFMQLAGPRLTMPPAATEISPRK